MTKPNEPVPVHQEGSQTSRPAAIEGWGPIMSLRDEIDRLFDDFGGGLWRRPWTHRPAAQPWNAMASRMSPKVEVVDCNGEYRIAAEVPGLSAEDVEVTLHDGMLTIRGEKTEERREGKADYLVSERRYGSFHRTMPLPVGADGDKITANLANGVLTITVPRSEAAKATERKIEIKAA